MFLRSLNIDLQTPVSEIVSRDYRTVDVFRKHGIEYCCGGRWPLSTACLMKGLDGSQIIEELHEASRDFQLPGTFPYENWSVGFLVDYIINVHHSYLYKTLPELEPILEHFVEEHQNKYSYLVELLSTFKKLTKEIQPHLKQEDEVIFPYIRQVGRAWGNKDSYAGLLVKTLRKPAGAIWDQKHKLLSGILYKWRELTDNYFPPVQSCVSHRVVFAKLKELDNMIAQQIFLENDILFPKTSQIENELIALP